MDLSANFYIQPNGELKFITKFRHHLPVDGFKESKTAIKYNDPTWILEEDILPLIKENWEDGYRPFSGAQLYS